MLLLAAAPQVAHAASRMARRVDGGDLVLAKMQLVPVFQLLCCNVYATAGGRCGFGACVLRQQTGAGDVVGVGMGFHRPLQGQPVLTQHLQIALQLGIDRIDDDGAPSGRIDQHIGIGAGGGVKQLQRVHGGLSEQ